MEKEIEKAIRETLVISNPQSIHRAVKKILTIPDVVRQSEQLKAFDEVFQIAWELAQEESDYSRLLKIKKSRFNGVI